jgi:phosphohistidine phosphatase
VYELYLIRHGLAEARGDAWPDDARRPLSARGRARMRKSARGLARIGVTLDLVLTSPLARARETAEIVATAWKGGPPVVAVDSLAPGGGYEALVADLGKHAARHRIALVGHAPAIDELARRLGGLSRPLEFKKGAVCRIDLDRLPPGGAGALRWFATPKMLRAAAR